MVARREVHRLCGSGVPWPTCGTDRTHVSIVNVATGAVRAAHEVARSQRLSAALFGSDGRTVLFTIEDSGNAHLGRVSILGGPVERVVTGRTRRRGLSIDTRGKVASSSWKASPRSVRDLRSRWRGHPPAHEDERRAAEGHQARPVERFKSKSKDGTMIDGFLLRPADAKPGEKVPTILRIHGGPASQYSTAFELRAAVLRRPGLRRGREQSARLHGLRPRLQLRALREVGRARLRRRDGRWWITRCRAGVADPDRLGVGGWSYGGILTNYVIAKTHAFQGRDLRRFRVQHHRGLRHRSLPVRVRSGTRPALEERRGLLEALESVPERRSASRHPTLFLCGEDDMNVPLLNTEQMYQAVRRLGVPTELVIYPGQNHGIAPRAIRRTASSAT
jgi:dipeptidyl aminopeptidase/acylaminoacyl peptidase